MWNLEKCTDEPVCKAEIETQMWRTKAWTSREESGEGRVVAMVVVMV